MRVEKLVRRLGEAATFAEVSLVVCEHARRELDAQQSTVTLFTTAGKFAMVADDLDPVTTGYTDAQRLAWIATSPIDPDLREMLATHAPVGDDDSAKRLEEFARAAGYSGPMLKARCSPLIEPTGLLGSVRTGCSVSLSRALLRDIDVMASYAAARLCRLGITAVAPAAAFDTLTPRQAHVAQLAARGFANREIADAIEISINTVKKLLKQVFARLDVFNRTELATLLARVAPRDDLQPGISVIGDLRVTKAVPESAAAAFPRRA